MTPEEFPIDLNVKPDFQGNCVLTTDFGIGLAYLGVQERDAEGRCYATKWFILLGMPIWPISRDLIRSKGITACHHSQQFRYDWFASEEILIGEILQILVFRWVLAPLFIGLIPISIFSYFSTIVSWIFNMCRDAGWKITDDSLVGFLVGATGAAWLVVTALFLSHMRMKKLLGNVKETRTRASGLFDFDEL